MARTSICISVPGVTPRFEDVRRSVRAVDEHCIDTELCGVDLFYSPDSDAALIVVHVQGGRIDDRFLRAIETEAHRAGGSVVDINSTGPEARRLAESSAEPFQLRLTGLRSSAAAMQLLGRKLGATAVADNESIASPSPLQVEFRRGDAWRPGRVRRLTATSISIATGCPPAKGANIPIHLRLGKVDFVVNAVVLAVTPPETAAIMGAFRFGARFIDVAPQHERGLAQLENRVGLDDELTRQPPKRLHPRYPVRWPIDLGLLEDGESLAAIDISLGGMFVASSRLVRPGTPTGVHLFVDDGGESVRAGAHVVRRIPPQATSSPSLLPGFGLKLTTMTVSDAKRYAAFVRLVARRSRFRIVVAAADGVVQGMLSDLASVGYAATAAANPDTLLRAIADRHPDLVLVDNSLGITRGEAILILSAAGHNRAIPVRVGSYRHEPWRMADRVLLG